MNTSTAGPMLCAHCGRPMRASVQVGGLFYHYECTESPYAGRPSYAQTRRGVVYVCPLKDIECGDTPASWCRSCPKKDAP